LLAQRTSNLKRLYRIPFDVFEEFSTGKADTILVNSKFTKQVFHLTFKSILKEPHVLYPVINVESYNTQSPLFQG
jgi:alpha-1,3/alpha-1,6-mannosyltransferase